MFRSRVGICSMRESIWNTESVIQHLLAGFKIFHISGYISNSLLLLEQTSRIIRAHVMHNSGVMVVSASTSEWAITRHLYRNTDMAAFINLARVFGVRCMESGITEMMCDLQRTPGGKVEAFVSELERTGISLTEPPRFKPWRPWDQYRPEKPWEVTE
ncbi:large ribosomal subunit protein uL18m isoform X2 [Anabrus simplex]|uniref:large ribosomal subunit protein uL18m isoform X2 n=1 Tax=Anabrus simplex TaxID=316456 RepID=UPI0035A35F7A